MLPFRLSGVGMDLHELSLSEAIRTNRLEDFIRQEQQRGIGPANERDLMAAITAISSPVKSAQLAGRTSRSASRGGSGGK